MDINIFMQNITVYYGEYENQQLKKIVVGYINKEIKESEFKELLKTVYSYHKAIFKAPCIATIEECIDKARLKKGKYEPYKIKETVVREHKYKEEKPMTKEEFRSSQSILNDLKKSFKHNKA